MDAEWQPDADTRSLIWGYCLQNALQYEGKGQVGSVIGRIMGEREDLRAHGKAVSPLVAEMVAKANGMADNGLEKLRSEIESIAPHLLEKKTRERRQGLPELKGAKEEMVLRFAPNPNGPLTFGHSRGLIINSEYAKSSNGTLILRFDDTDTVRKPPLPEAYAMIEEEVKWLTGIEPLVVIASERMEEYHRYAERLFEIGGCYVCRCSSEEFKQHRVDKTNCPHRDTIVETNLSIWAQMKDGTLQPGDAVVRVKTDMTLPNPALRDWPAFRIQDTKTNPHPRQSIGSRWRVWPLLDFQSAVEDHLQGVTHIIRGKDLMDSTRKQVLLYEKFGWDYPETVYWGRVKVHEFGGFSTSGMRKDIEEGLYDGWSDSRLPTISSMRRRGITPEALRAFWVELGLTQKDISVPLSSLYSHNTKVIDRTCPRLSLIRNPVRLQLTGDGWPEEVVMPSHPEHDEIPPRRVVVENIIHIEKDDLDRVGDGGMLRLKDLADIRIQGPVAELVSLEPTGGLDKVHWVTDGVDTLLDDGSEQGIRIESLIEKHSHATGTQVQLERIGYAVIEDDGYVLSHS